jgi:hypothetical protein
MKSFEYTKDCYWNRLKNDEDRKWLDCLSGLRNQYYQKAGHIEKLVTLLESLDWVEESNETYNSLLALAKKTYALKVLEVDALTGNPSKCKIVETNQGGEL